MKFGIFHCFIGSSQESYIHNEPITWHSLLKSGQSFFFTSDIREKLQRVVVEWASSIEDRGMTMKFHMFWSVDSLRSQRKHTGD